MSPKANTRASDVLTTTVAMLGILTTAAGLFVQVPADSEAIVATRPIASGEFIDSYAIEVKAVPSDRPTSGALVVRTQAEGGLIAAHDIAAGWPLTVADVLAVPTNRSAVISQTDRRGRPLQWLVIPGVLLIAIGIKRMSRSTRRSSRPDLSSLLPTDADSRVALVEIGDDEAEVLWQSPEPAPRLPWTVADGGWAWRLSQEGITADDLTAEIQVSVPLIRHIGDREGRRLLINTRTVRFDDCSRRPTNSDRQAESSATQTWTTAWIVSDGTGAAILMPFGISFNPLQTDSTERPIEACIDTHDDTVNALLPELDDSNALVDLTALAPDESDITSDAAPAAQVRDARHCAAPDSCYRIQVDEDRTAGIRPPRIDFDPSVVLLEAPEVIDETVGELHESMLDPAPERAAKPAVVAPPVSFDDVDDESADAAGTRPGASCEPPGICLMPPILVKVFGVPSVRERPNMPRRELITTVVLACHGRPIAGSVVQDAIYGDNPIGKKTLWNVMGYARDALGVFDDDTDIFPQFDRVANKMSLDPRVKTDVAVLGESLELARTLSTAEAVAVLTAAHQLIEGPPFDADGFQWAHDEQFVAEASNLIESATADLVDLAIEARVIDVARAAIRRGFRALRDNEGLYRCRMKVEHAAGNPGNVHKTYDELRTYLATVGTEPARETVELLAQLSGPPTKDPTA